MAFFVNFANEKVVLEYIDRTDAMKRIMYLTDAIAILGGMERLLADKLNMFVSQGDFNVCLLTTNQGSHPLVFPLSPLVECHDLEILFHQRYRYSGLQRLWVGRQKHQLLRQRLASQIQAFRPDVIVCIRLELIPDLLRVSGTIPVVFESHMSCLCYRFENFPFRVKCQVWWRHHVLKHIHTIVALTHGDALEWMKINPQVKVIPNVVHLNDSGRFSDCQSKNIIFIGRYSKQKDVWSLMKIWKIVRQRHPDWTLNVYGDYGDQRDVLISEIKKMNSNVVLHEPTANIGKEYLKNSMLLLTSLYEPFGLVMPEAMSYGLPVVAFDCPYGPAEIITDGVDGFLIKDRNVEDFADKVCQLIEDEELRRSMGAAGIKSSLRFSAENIMPMWKDLFESI